MGNPLLTGFRPTHPGEVLREDVLPSVLVTKTELAAMLCISRQTLYGILNEREPVTPRIAIRLGHVFGNSPEFWARMQLAHDLAREAEKVDLSHAPTLERPEPAR
jgi:addiction module HigA family antidote